MSACPVAVPCSPAFRPPSSGLCPQPRPGRFIFAFSPARGQRTAETSFPNLTLRNPTSGAIRDLIHMERLLDSRHASRDRRRVGRPPPRHPRPRLQRRIVRSSGLSNCLQVRIRDRMSTISRQQTRITGLLYEPPLWTWRQRCRTSVRLRRI